jgi:biopolymer transport protein ExbD
MASKRRFVDVWIVESNTVYREVPYEVAIDWIQQGRLLENDMLRWSGQAEWFRLGGTPAFAAYLPRSEPFRAEDEAEAREPVEVDFHWRRREDDDEDDVDMIPLIDVSLVLLIFFLMISTGATAAAMFSNPQALSGIPGNREFWVGVNADANGDPRQFSLGKEEKVIVQEAEWNKFVPKMAEEFDKLQGKVTVVIMGDGDLKFEYEVKLLAELEKYKAKIISKKIGVSDKGSVK